MPEPRRKDRSKAREKPEGLEPAEEENPPPEEYTTYRQTDGGEVPEEDAEAMREADLQPGGAGGEGTDRERTEGRPGAGGG
ncbi:MAG: hypothetical protein KY466_01905 [Gemmatimonadetes bacterium]|nr:hypothetical protein [Gemmatimonadota bacterium]